MCFAEVGVCSTPANRPLGVARGSASARDADASVELIKQQTEANQKAALKSLLNTHASRSKVPGSAFEAAVILIYGSTNPRVPRDVLETVLAVGLVNAKLH